MPARFVVVSNLTGTAWLATLTKVLAPRGGLEIVGEGDAVEWMLRSDCDAVAIVDAASIRDVLPVVRGLRERCPQARIAVATASPHWRQAREAFQAGATAYIQQSLNEDDLWRDVTWILDRPTPQRATHAADER